MTTHVMNQTSAAAQRSARRPTAGNGLGGSLPTGSNRILHAHVLGRAVRHLQAQYATLEQDLVRSTVHAAYRELDRTARLKTFLPTLAVREAGERLRRLADAAGSPLPAHGTTAAPIAA